MAESSQTLHNEIAQIEQSLAQKKEQLKTEQDTGKMESMPDDKEVLHEVVGEHINSDVSAPTATQTDDSQTTLPPLTDDIPSYMTPELQSKVQSLVNMAFSDSIDKAAKMAKETRNPALMDAFHDAIVDQLYDHLVEQGKLKKVD